MGTAVRAGFTADASSTPPLVAQPHSAWHSPVPYLFGGLAAMLGLIAFALLLLACSYWKLSGYLEGGSRDADLEAASGELSETAGHSKPPSTIFEERIVVIMAGDKKPTFLATPASSRAWPPPIGDAGDSDRKKNEKSVENEDEGEGKKENCAVSSPSGDSTAAPSRDANRDGETNPER